MTLLGLAFLICLGFLLVWMALFSLDKRNEDRFQALIDEIYRLEGTQRRALNDYHENSLLPSLQLFAWQRSKDLAALDSSQYQSKEAKLEDTTRAKKTPLTQSQVDELRSLF